MKVCKSEGTVDSAFNEPRGETENSSLYQEFLIYRKIQKLYFFSQILHYRLDVYLKPNERGEDDKNLHFE